MSRSYHREYTGSVPDYHEYAPDYSYSSSNSRPNDNSTPRLAHSALPSEGHDYYMHDLGQRSSRRDGNRARGQESAWEISQSLYDGSHYDRDYEQGDLYDRRPLNETSDQHPRNNGHPPIASHYITLGDGPDYLSDYSRPEREQGRSTTQAMNTDQQYLNLQQPSHYSTGQWTGDSYDNPLPAYDAPSYPYSGIPQSIASQHSQSQVSLPAPSTRLHQRAPLGPPPSSRRGPATYYPDTRPVHPIVEETDSVRSSFPNESVRMGDHHSKASIASSSAIPIGMLQGPFDDRFGSRPGTAEYAPIPEDFHEMPQDDHAIDLAAQRLNVTSRVVSTISNSGSGSGSGNSSSDRLVTNSLANQHQPSSSEDTFTTAYETKRSQAPTKEALKRQAKSGAVHEQQHGRISKSPTPDAGANQAPMQQKGDIDVHTLKLPRQSGASRSNGSVSSHSERDLRRTTTEELSVAASPKPSQAQRSRRISPATQHDEDPVNSILSSLERGGVISAYNAADLKKPSGGTSEKPGKRRPPRLDVDAVRAAEARGSLSSLTDLIKRATKLASNLDRGKTASRLGMSWFDATDEDEKPRSGSLSAALNSFPVPHSTNAPGSRAELRKSQTSGRRQHSALASNSDLGETEARKRKCCGIPIWAFILLMLLLLILIAAAVVLPVVFVVLPKHRHDPNPAQSTCGTLLLCQNGGTITLSSEGQCECVCSNGFSGQTCSDPPAQGCTTTSIGNINDVTLGDAIPSLLKGSQSNFSIPLDGQQLLGLFSNSSLSCSEQNALVNFNSKARKRSAILMNTGLLARTPALVRKAPASTATSDTPASATSAPGGTPTSAPQGDGDTSTATQDGTVLDFARVTVLYLFQVTKDLNSAANAQERLQTYFGTVHKNSSNGSNPTNVTLGGTASCDMTAYTINLGNGTVVGKNAS